MDDNPNCFKCGAAMESVRRTCPNCGVDQLSVGDTLAFPDLEIDTLNPGPGGTFWTRQGCAVCNPLASFQTGGPRGHIASSIVAILQRQGSYSPSGPVQFWQGHRDHLCSLCQVKLDGITSTKQRALALLEEAVRLDPKNEPARQNLAAVRNML